MRRNCICRTEKLRIWLRFYIQSIIFLSQLCRDTFDNVLAENTALKYNHDTEYCMIVP